MLIGCLCVRACAADPAQLYVRRATCRFVTTSLTVANAGGYMIFEDLDVTSSCAALLFSSRAADKCFGCAAYSENRNGARPGDSTNGVALTFFAYGMESVSLFAACRRGYLICSTRRDPTSFTSTFAATYPCREPQCTSFTCDNSQSLTAGAGVPWAIISSVTATTPCHAALVQTCRCVVVDEVPVSHNCGAQEVGRIGAGGYALTAIDGVASGYYIDDVITLNGIRSIVGYLRRHAAPPRDRVVVSRSIIIHAKGDQAAEKEVMCVIGILDEGPPENFTSPAGADSAGMPRVTLLLVLTSHLCVGCSSLRLQSIRSASTGCPGHLCCWYVTVALVAVMIALLSVFGCCLLTLAQATSHLNTPRAKIWV